MATATKPARADKAAPKARAKAKATAKKAAPKRRTRVINEAWRDKIQASNLLTRLQKHADGKVDMTPTQIKAAEILLRKTIPDLKQIEHKTDGDGAMVPAFMMYLPK